MTRKKPDGELKKRGRKSLFDPNKHLPLVKELAESGKTNEQIAGALNIDRATLNTWMHKHPEFLSTIKKGKEYADSEVSDSLFNRAKGGLKIREIKIIENPDGSTRKEITEKELPADVTAGKFWLMNRQPEVWRDKQVQEITGKDGAPIKTETTLDISKEVRKLVGILPAVKL
ncbi:hypothetical protein [Methanoregula sp.]|jgi:transposase-like protein|uniref:hypothetical protein n=1 Tax=Methanoregula sp. TaxID=2052170 RepID=UPI003565B756